MSSATSLAQRRYGRNSFASLRAGGRSYRAARLNWQPAVAKYSDSLRPGAVAP